MNERFDIRKEKILAVRERRNTNYAKNSNYSGI
jgi:hypothetical protein